MKSYFTDRSYEDVFQYIADGVYKFDSKMIMSTDFALKKVQKEKEENVDVSFSIVSRAEEFLDESDIYFVDLIFSNDIEFETITLDSFIIENINGEQFSPDAVFVSSREVIIAFKTKRDLKAHLILLKNIFEEEEVLGEVGGETIMKKKEVLDGYISLYLQPDRYVELTEIVNNTYEAYIGEDIIFEAPQLSFGRFHNLIETDSTLAIKMGANETLSEKCMVMVFGNDLEQQNGSGLIPTTGFSLLSKSNGEVPVKKDVVENFELQKQKSFLGFSYLKDMERDTDNNYLLYINLEAPSGLERGKYETTMSFELFCPNGS